MNALHRHLTRGMGAIEALLPLSGRYLLPTRYPAYCSAFADTDAPFGSVGRLFRSDQCAFIASPSLGSFFEFEPSCGSYEVNPPFIAEIISRMVDHLELLLARTEGVVIVEVVCA